MIGSPTGGPKSPAADPPVSESASYENRPKVRNKLKPMVADDVMLRFFIDVGPFDFCEAMEMQQHRIMVERSRNKNPGIYVTAYKIVLMKDRLGVTSLQNTAGELQLEF